MGTSRELIEALQEDPHVLSQAEVLSEASAGSAAPAMFLSWVDKAVEGLKEAVGNLKMWARPLGAKEKLLVGDVEKALRILMDYQDKAAGKPK